ncbi:DUF2459 domain-containing protein [Altererythrobacter xixiisoli]|uniref:DUF2459 domain-containing protein n=1 Tax=Croceibacterium xixiisoli TaxID=1476466 RepID=A0A6I4TT61_9SPHN|nr:DUF2459 domain-containing protein [Croceibacterium xixiisoli]MXO99074.1 DUF2459 domain-containing protein [Croceibacterium xixiisoli]
MRIARLIGRWAAIALGLILLLAALFALSGWIGSSIARNDEWKEPAPGTPGSVEIMVETNGVHTALVLPLVTADKDWRGDFPAGDVQAVRAYTHVSISWGEKEVFINTPTWADLSPMTVLRIIGIGGDGLLHIAHYERPAASPNLRPLRLTGAEYARLVAAIEKSLPVEPRVRYPGYGRQDVFYDAPGRYTITNTCNQWTSDVLATAGVRIGSWTPLSGGVMKWIESPQ